MNNGKVASVNISTKKGIIKQSVPTIKLNKFGIKNDAHAGKWNRQVSLLAIESITDFQKKLNRNIQNGEFAENITTKDIRLTDVSPLDVLQINNTRLLVTQIGKKCHGNNCSIFQEVGECVMPVEGIFARVIKKGNISVNDNIFHTPKVFSVKIITLSDRANKGVYEDTSGKLLIKLVNQFFENNNRTVNVSYQLLPDNKFRLNRTLIKAEKKGTDIIITSGGTGIGKRDITHETVKSFIDKELTGINDYIRLKYGNDKPAALLSRSITGVKNKTLIFALPGSNKAVMEYFDEIKHHFFHILYMLNGLDIH